MTAKMNASLLEVSLISRITQRAVSLHPKYRRIDLTVDLELCISIGCHLYLAKLLAAQDHDFSHDVFGIHQNIDRETGQLRNCFSPRFSKPEEEQ